MPKSNLKYRLKRAIVLGVSLLALFSCTQKKHLVYLRVPENTTDSIYNVKIPVYTLQNQDILYIKAVSPTGLDADFLSTNPGQMQAQMSQSDAGLYINSFSINDSGYVSIPVAGKVKVSGMTLDQAQQVISDKVKYYLKDVTVIVKLLSFRVSVIGEVNRPGMYRNYSNELSILEALSLAGDVNQYGNRKKITVIRTTPAGNQTFLLDLTHRDILKSKAFYLQPNDIVYVEPVPTKTFQVNIPTISIFLSTLTTFVLVLNYLK
jgi:polysaccharide export outer membrane protein